MSSFPFVGEDKSKLRNNERPVPERVVLDVARIKARSVPNDLYLEWYDEWDGLTGTWYEFLDNKKDEHFKKKEIK